MTQVHADTLPVIDQKFSLVTKLMGNRFEFTVIANNKAFAESAINKAVEEVKRIEKVFSTFNTDSEINKINDNSGIKPLQVSEEVYQLIRRSIKISEITQGAFDITYGSIDKKLWNFDMTMTSLPDAATARQSVRLINYKNIFIDGAHQTVFLKEKGMRLGFGGIGKGYAAEKAKQVLIAEGIAAGIVNAAGDLTTWGVQANKKPWTVGIANPDMASQVFSELEISNKAIATSGSYIKFVMINGKKYSHTIDPRTGMPVSGIKSVTIIAPDAELADALATPVTVMGVKAGLYLINQLPGVHCIIIDDDNRLVTSKNINLI